MLITLHMGLFVSKPSCPSPGSTREPRQGALGGDGGHRGGGISRVPCPSQGPPGLPKPFPAPSQNHGAVDPTMNCHFRNIQTLARPTLKLLLFLFVNICFFLKVHFTFSSRVLCLLVSALNCFHSTLHDHGRSLLLDECVHGGPEGSGPRPEPGLCS